MKIRILLSLIPNKYYWDLGIMDKLVMEIDNYHSINHAKIGIFQNKNNSFYDYNTDSSISVNL